MSEQGAPDVGFRLRALRQKRGFSVRTLAERCGLSPNTISLIERGESSPSVSTLHRLAIALGVPITAFFEEPAEAVQAVLTRAAERRRSGSAGLLLESLGTGLAEQALQPFMVTMEPGADSGRQPIVHGGQEMVFCVHGELEYEVAGRPYRLAVGDALLFDARLSHRWSNPGASPTTFLLVIGASSQPSQVSHSAEEHLRV